uniref:DUF4198 domain-containing protein n=1 Tax=Pararhizobium sp. IMCC3301 TaxID=3067904 RepID=UPI0027419481|nr:DUF4198 domain-containing protein [Pararhizobium sp. IMCC3301]
MSFVSLVATKFRCLTLFGALAALALAITDTKAHEFWIEPNVSQIETGDKFSATLNVGQDLAGSTYPYLPPRFDRFTMTIGGNTKPVEGRIGDNPALQMEAAQEGLHIIAYQSRGDVLTYVDPAKFQQFLDYEGLDWVLEAHQKRGLPTAYFKEIYTRFAKSLVQVGPYQEDDAGQNQAVGLPIELVALQSPYAPQTSRVDVLLLREGKPLENIQVATFQRMNDSTVARRLTRSNAEGVANITLDGGGFYLISAVQMEETDPAKFKEDTAGRKPVWHSLWASLSFRLEAD